MFYEQKTLFHLDPCFLEIAEKLKEMIRRIMNTKNTLTIPISRTGSAGIEAAFVNLVERGDRVLVLLNGVFGMRMADVAMNPVAEIGDLLKGSDSICLADAFTSLGGIEVRMDDWDIDALSSGTQKCLSCPPGLALLSFLEKAMGILNKRKTKVPKWYLNLSLIADYWGQNRVYHHTALVNMLYGLFYIRRCFFFLRKGRKRYFSDTKKTIRLL